MLSGLSLIARYGFDVPWDTHEMQFEQGFEGLKVRRVLTVTSPLIASHLQACLTNWVFISIHEIMVRSLSLNSSAVHARIWGFVSGVSTSS